MKIIANMLKEAGAVCNDTNKFAKLFPEGAELTRENVLLAAQKDLDIGWFVSRIGGNQRYDRFHELTSAAWDEFLATRRAACREELRLEQEATAQHNAAARAVHEQTKKDLVPIYQTWHEAVAAAVIEVFRDE